MIAFVRRLFVAILVLAVIFVVGMRRKWPPVLNAVRRASRAYKPVVLKTAGTKGAPTAVVRHTGRRSGRPYETPVVAASTPDGFVIALPYGANTDWLKNVLASGSATVVTDGSTYVVDHPEVIPITDVETYFGVNEQRQHRQFAVVDALRVRRAVVPRQEEADSTAATRA
jgi:deazaflavin-dependent oxidoreductase (nitroreductase family)